MRIVFIGDVFGSSGRAAVQKYLTPIFQTLKPDVVIANGENAAHGIGITPGMCEDLYKSGVDVITLGNHAFDKHEIVKTLNEDTRICRPANYPAGTPGRGHVIHTLDDGRKLAVINIMGNLFMGSGLDDPFAVMDTLVKTLDTPFVFVDMHAEATSEKQALAYFLDGRVSAVIGTHTHAPTCDTRILPSGTAYQSDAGMTGDYESVIGMDKAAPLERFVTKIRTLKNQPSEGPATLCGVVIDLDDKGRATAIEQIRLGGALKETPLALVAEALTS